MPLGPCFRKDDGKKNGRYDDVAHSVAFDDRQKAADEELLDNAAIQTLRRRGRVLAMPRDALPGGSVAAALLRY